MFNFNDKKDNDFGMIKHTPVQPADAFDFKSDDSVRIALATAAVATAAVMVVKKIFEDD